MQVKREIICKKDRFYLSHTPSNNQFKMKKDHLVLRQDRAARGCAIFRDTQCA